MPAAKSRKPRLALIGPDSLRGREVLNVLAAKKFPMASIELYDPAVEEEYSQLGQFGGDPKVVHALSPSALEGLDLVFLAGDSGTNRTYGRLAAEKEYQAIDLAETFNAEPDVPLVVAGVNDGSLRDEKPPLVANPNPATIMLAHLLKALQEGFGLVQALAFVLEPVSAYAEEGIQELADQSVALLGSSAVRRKVFPGQVAFNLLPRTAKPEPNGFSPLENRVLAEVRRVLGPEDIPLSLTIVLAPVFHTFSIMTHVVLERRAKAADLGACFRKNDIFRLSPAGGRDVVSPVTVAGKDRIFMGRVKPDARDPRGFWIWMVADNLTLGSALNAHGVARALVGVP
jgi:aspartate-semialdehyde dehydrogenase